MPSGALRLREKTCFWGNFTLLDNKIIHKAIWPLWNKSYRFIKVEVFLKESVQMGFSEDYEHMNAIDRERAPS